MSLHANVIVPVLFLLSLLSAPPAFADRDIVYAARYYAPPGSHRTSHFHIYRINPDGTGKTQLTFGRADDYKPKWSPDGRRITYVQANGDFSLLTLCEIRPNGSGRRVLKRLDSSWEATPPPVPGYHLENVGSESDDTTQHVLINLRTGRHLALKVPAHDDLSDVLMPMPGHGLVYAANNRNSTIGTNYLFYRLNPDTGALHYLTEGRFIAWSPDGSQFCIAPGRETASYEKRPQPYAVEKGASKDDVTVAEYRQVSVAPLSVRATAGGPMRQLTPRLSEVEAADWRKVK